MKSPKVVLIDDEVEVCEILTISLTARGYNVAMAHNGEDGLKLIKQFKPDVAVIDIQMPCVNGYELIVQLHKMPELSDMKIIVMTSLAGNGDTSDKNWADNLGVDSFLPKPFPPSDLADLINQLLNPA